MIKNMAAGALVGALALASGTTALAADTATQTLSLEILEINEISVAGVVTLTVGTATAGSAPNSASASSTYAITTNGGADGKKITARLDSGLPGGLALQVAVSAPTTATSAGPVALTTTAVDVVTGIDSVAVGGLNIDYTLTATVAAATGTIQRGVIYTIDSN